MSDTYMSNEEKAIERIARRRFEQMGRGYGTDATDRALFDKIKKDVEAEFILNNGREPKRGIF